MNVQNLNWIANFIWGIADDVLRDVYVRGKYRDVILPNEQFDYIDWKDADKIRQVIGTRSRRRSPRTGPTSTRCRTRTVRTHASTAPCSA